jgi:hypothetical protein
MTADDSGLTAALLTLTLHAERLGQLETSVAAGLQQCEIATEGLMDAVGDLRTLVQQQGQLIDDLSRLVATLVPADDDDSPGYKPRPPVHWWKIAGDERRKAVDHLAAWVEQVYRPHYGHLATGLGTCWQDHPLCLVGLEIVSELHSVLYFNKRAAALLSAQAEFQIRTLPVFAEQWRTETSKCTHRPEAATGSAWRGAR